MLAARDGPVRWCSRISLDRAEGSTNAPGRDSYTYDFGDDWQHTIKVERRFSAELWEQYPRLVDAKSRCPPDDAGGPWGYAEYLEAMSDPAHKRHAELIGWFGHRDPNDRPAIETALARFAGETQVPAKSL